MNVGTDALSDTQQLNGPPPGSGATPVVYDRTKRRSNIIEVGWDSWAKKITDRLHDVERHYDYAVYRDAIKSRKYYAGEYAWRFANSAGLVRDLPHSDIDARFPRNYFAYFVDLSVSSALEANPDIICDPADQREQNKYSSRGLQKLTDFSEQEILTPDLLLESEKARELDGGIWWYFYWDVDAGKLYAPEPIIEERSATIGADSFACRCGNSGPTSRLVKNPLGLQCPLCGVSPKIFKAPIAQIKEITGYEQVKIGFPRLQIVSILEMHGDRRLGDYMNGQYVFRERMVDKDLAASKYTWWAPKRQDAGPSTPSRDFGIEFQELARRPLIEDGISPLSTDMRGRDLEDVFYGQYWLLPPKYEYVEFSQDQRFVGAEETVVPARTRLGEIFPTGLNLSKLGDDFVDHRKEDWRKHWLYTKYIHEPDKPDGKGMKDMHEPQREVIDLRSMEFIYHKARSGGMPTIIKHLYLKLH